MERKAFLSNLSERLSVPAEPNLPHPLKEVREIPRIRYKRDLSDPVAAFVEVATGLGVIVREVTGANDMRALLGEMARTYDVKGAVVSKDPETAGIEVFLQGIGVETIEFDSPGASARADLGVTGAMYGLAATGSMVVHAGRAKGRTASLLPPVHLGLLRPENILTDSAELFRKIPERLPDGMPSQLVFITGPSRSADIELELTVGVHGPKTVWIGILT